MKQGEECRLEMALRVAWLLPVIPNYRIPFLKHISKVSQLKMTCFHGEGKKGVSVRSVGPDLPVKSIWVRNYFWPLGGARTLWQGGIARILRGPYDAVICPEAVHNIENLIILLLQWAHGKKVIIYGYGFRPGNKNGLAAIFRNLARKLMLKLSDAIIVYTERGYKKCLHMGLSPERIFISGNTLDTKYLMSLQQCILQDELESLCRKFNLAEKNVLLFVGRLSSVKRLDVLIKAFRQLQGDLKNNWVLLIVGEGKEKRNLLKSIEGLNDVYYLGPIYDERELTKIFMISDLLVIPGRVGLTCVHGFCYGVPVLTSRTDVEQSPEFDYIEHQKNGFLIDKPCPDEYARAISDLFNNPHALEIMGRYARETAQSLTMSNMVQAFVDAVKFVVQGV